jgi:uncharacterized RDD family membrane protein YckC
MIYESLLLFGLIAVTSGIFDVSTESRHALYLRHERALLIFIVIGVYFTYFWCKGGQTLAMKTWKVRLITSDNQNISPFKAGLRYLLSWMWFFPAIIAIELLQLKQEWIFISLALGMLIWISTIFISKDRQFLHDSLLKTRLVSYAPPLKKNIDTD